MEFPVNIPLMKKEEVVLFDNWLKNDENYIIIFNYISSRTKTENDAYLLFRSIISFEIVDEFTLSSRQQQGNKEREWAGGSDILNLIWLDVCQDKFGMVEGSKCVAKFFSRHRVENNKKK